MFASKSTTNPAQDINTLTDGEIITERKQGRRAVLARSGVILLGAIAFLSSARSAHADGKSRNDSDSGTLADPHICDSDSQTDRCGDGDTRTYGDPKFSNDSDAQ